MKRIAIVLVFLLLITFIAPSVYAESGLQLGLKLGYSLPMGDWGDYFDGTFAYGVSAGYNPLPNLEIEAAFLRHSHGSDKIEDAITWYTGIPVALDVNINELTLNGKYCFPIDQVRPFVTGGIGMYFWEIEASAYGVSVSESENDFGFNFGGGLDFDVAANLSLGIELKYNIVTGDFDDTYLNFLGLATYLF